MPTKKYITEDLDEIEKKIRKLMFNAKSRRCCEANNVELTPLRIKSEDKYAMRKERFVYVPHLQGRTLRITFGKTYEDGVILHVYITADPKPEFRGCHMVILQFYDGKDYKNDQVQDFGPVDGIPSFCIDYKTFEKSFQKYIEHIGEYMKKKEFGYVSSTAPQTAG